MIDLRKNLRNSIAGITLATRDRSFRAELVMGLVLLPMVVVFSESTAATLVAIGTYVLLLSTELINTAIETLCDRVTREHDESIKAVKDIASAAVFLILLLFLLQCAMILVGTPKL